VTIADWLSDRGTGAPAQLVDGVRDALGPEGSRPAAEAAEVLIDVTERELAKWLAEDPPSRTGAVPLLTIDALVTLALEAAAERPGDIDAIAERALVRLSALAGSERNRRSDSRFSIPDSRPIDERSR
jgi:hypothetical protein